MIISDLHIGDNLHNDGIIKIVGTEGNIVIGRDLHNKGSIISKDGIFVARSIKEGGCSETEPSDILIAFLAVFFFLFLCKRKIINETE